MAREVEVVLVGWLLDLEREFDGLLGAAAGGGGGGGFLGRAYLLSELVIFVGVSTLLR